MDRSIFQIFFKHVNKYLLTSLLLLSAYDGICQKSTVYFKFDDFSLDKRSKELIDSLAKINSIQTIKLQGHCDSVGSNEYNDALSLKRVNEVKNHFESQNIPKDKIEIKAFGKRLPLNNNKTEKERALNRRVDIELILHATADTAIKEPVKPLNTNEAEIDINGVVVDENKNPLVAKISLNDKHGNEIQSTISTPDGKYNLKVVLYKREDYSLTYFNDSSFVSTKRINISNRNLPYQNLLTILPVLKNGNKYILENLNFEGDTSQLVPASLPSLEALYQLMKENKSLVIRIEGHVNYPAYWPDPKGIRKRSERYVPPGMNSDEFNKWLSEERAKSVYNYLVAKGIDEKRLSTIGFGASKMLFPYANNESEMGQNRRVEINVISVK